MQRAGVKFGAALGVLIALGLVLAAPIVAARYQTPRLTTFVRIAALIPLLYSVYAVFIGSANGLRRFRTQASFDVLFSTMKTILLLGCAFLWSVGGAFAGFVGAAALITVIASRVMRLPAAGEPFPVRRIAAFMGTVVVYAALLNYTLNFDVLLLRWFALSVWRCAGDGGGADRKLRCAAHDRALAISGAAGGDVRDFSAGVALDIRRRL